MLRPTAIEVEPLQNYRLRVVFDNSTVGIFDVTPYIKANGMGNLQIRRISIALQPMASQLHGLMVRTYARTSYTRTQSKPHPIEFFSEI